MLRRIFDLPWRDMYEVWSVTGSYLDPFATGGESKEQKLLRERAAALNDVATVARELRLPAGKWPTIEEYQREAKRLGLAYSSQRIVRRWERWEDVGRTMTDAKPSETPAQRALRRAKSGRRRNHEEQLAGLRDWLGTKPASRTDLDYNWWADSENDRRGPGEQPYVTAQAVCIGLALSWRRVLAVAEHHSELADAQSQHLEELTGASGPLALIGAKGVALVLGVSVNRAAVLAGHADFPPPAAHLGRVRAWYRSDVEAHHAGKPFKRRKGGELDDKLMTSPEVQEMLGLSTNNSLHSRIHTASWHDVPQPEGRVSGALYWLRTDVETWMAAYPEKLAENRTRRPRKGAQSSR